MQARDLFGVVVRTVGIAMIIYGLYDIFFLVIMAMGMEYESHHSTELVAWAAGFFLLLGVAIIGAAERIVRLAYRG
jgi:hypothetical protein